MRTALVIEDDVHCSDLLEMVLGSIPDLQVHTAKSGLQALKRLATAEPCNLVVTDFHLPGQDGLSLIQAIHKMPGRDAVPFVLITSSRDGEIRRRAEALGASAFFEKPFSPARLREAVNSILDAL